MKAASTSEELSVTVHPHVCAASNLLRYTVQRSRQMPACGHGGKNLLKKHTHPAAAKKQFSVNAAGGSNVYGFKRLNAASERLGGTLKVNGFLRGVEPF